MSETKTLARTYNQVHLPRRYPAGKSGPDVTLALSTERYHVNAIGFAFAGAFPKRNTSLSLKYFNEFANRATFQGYSLQIVGAISF